MVYQSRIFNVAIVCVGVYIYTEPTRYKMFSAQGTFI